MVRKLRGPVKKETKSEKRQRRSENALAKKQILSIAVPVLIVVAVLVAGLVYLATRKK